MPQPSERSARPHGDEPSQREGGPDSPDDAPLTNPDAVEPPQPIPARPWLPWLAFGIVFGALAPGPLPGWWLAPLLAGIAMLIAVRLAMPWAGRWLLFLAACLAGTAIAQPQPPATDQTRLVAVTGTVSAVYWQSVWSAGARTSIDAVLTPERWKPPDQLFVHAGRAPLLRPGDQIEARGVWSRDRRGDRIDAVEVTITTPRERGPRAAAWIAFAELGERRDLAESLLIGQGRPPERADFRASGLSHVLAVSGMHLALAAALGAWLLQALGMPWAWRLGLLAGLCAGYAWLTGGSPATMRALAMVLVVTAAAATGREPHRLGPVSLAALVLVLIDPGQARDAGFQLSLAAVLGIVTLGMDLVGLRKRHLGLQPWPLDRPTWRGFLWCLRTTIDGLLVGAAAALATAPLVAWWFATANPWGVLATAVAGPCATAALWLGLPWLGLTSLWPDGPWTGLRFLLEISLESLARAAAWAATWPGATVPSPPPAAWLMCAWPLLFIRCPDLRTAAMRLGAVAGMLVLWMCFR
ncbi:hypothetical protein LBMAG53_35850 [Planctomycetota bacterium]|nr:hypothetical protein LBMAG53_35850 [Planctomycetota bacterium]